VRVRRGKKGGKILKRGQKKCRENGQGKMLKGPVKKAKGLALQGESSDEGLK